MDSEWRRLAAAVIVQAARDCVWPQKIRDDKRPAKAIRREAMAFFRRAARHNGPERLWFDVLGVRPETMLDALAGEMVRNSIEKKFFRRSSFTEPGTDAAKPF
ncbi:MAG: hypothetical protein K6T65_14805 [Peptococcaceae bacterium]|nr:hypothetical protein [Peptococcaceae bacterium]